MIRTYGLKARASAPSMAMLVTAGLAVMSAATTSGLGDSYLTDFKSTALCHLAPM